MAEEPSTSRPGSPGAVGSIRLMGVPVRVHFTFLLLLIFLLVVGFNGDQSLANYLLYVFALVASLLAHELAHALLARRFGMRTAEVVLFPIGGVSRLDRSAKPGEEFWIALVGPLVNILIALGLFGFLYSQRHSISFFALSTPTNANLVDRIALGNLIFASFNLLPAFPMDGGRVLRAFLSRFKPEDEATRIAAWAGRMLAISMGLYGLIYSEFLLVFVAFFVYLGAAQEGAAAMGRSLTHGIPVRAAMVTEYHTLSHGDTIRAAANLLLATSQQDFPVVHGDQVIGLLGRNALLRAMALEGPEAYVAGVMDRSYSVLSPDMDLADALPLMARAGTCALVMQGERLLGMLTSENLSQFLLLRRFGMQPTEVRA